MEDVTLNCSASVDDVTYSWHRVNGDVPPRSLGQNSNTLTIPKVTPSDFGEYYCIAKKEDITSKSNKAVVSVDGKVIIVMLYYNNHCDWVFIDWLSISLESKNSLIHFKPGMSGFLKLLSSKTWACVHMCVFVHPLSY